MRQSIGAGDRHRRLSDLATAQSARKTGSSGGQSATGGVWSSAGLPPRISKQMVTADRRATRRGVLATVTCLALLSVAGIGYFSQIELSKPASRSFSPIGDAFAATDMLFRAPPVVVANTPINTPISNPVSTPIKTPVVPALDAAAPLGQAGKPGGSAEKPTDKLPTEALVARPVDTASAVDAPAAATTPPPETKVAVAKDAPKSDPTPPSNTSLQATVALPSNTAAKSDPSPLAAVPSTSLPIVTRPETSVPSVAPQADQRASQPVLPAAPTATAALSSAPATDSPKAALVRKCRGDVEIAANAMIIAFDVNSSEISPVQQEQLKRFSGILRTCPEVKLEVAGHTDLKGQQERNFGLSWARAEAVIKVLRSHGLTAMEFTPFGYGPRRPLSQNTDNESYSPIDRRVELIVR
jgi:outer membrane protein OmpA-like peptidoglycan-associated protein